MLPFTTRQREILKIILDVKRPIGSVELAKLLNITPRQVNYSIKGVKVWLKQHGQDLHVVPGVGFSVNLTADQAQTLVQKINVHSNVQIILSVSQRQQLLALFLLTRAEPVILAHGRREWVSLNGRCPDGIRDGTRDRVLSRARGGDS